MPSLRSLYLENIGAILSRGDASKDQPALVADDPIQQISLKCFQQVGEGLITIVNHDGRAPRRLRHGPSITVGLWLKKFLEVCLSGGIQMRR